MISEALSAEKWTKDLKEAGATPNAMTDNVLRLLMVYGRLSRGPDSRGHEAKERRSRVLEDVEAYCVDVLRSEPRLSPFLRGRLVDVGVHARKSIKAIASGPAKWDSAFKVFKGSGKGRTEFIKHREMGRNISTPPTSSGNYWLELLDPKHRSWGHMDRRDFDDWYNDTQTDKGFFAWLDEKGRALTGLQVQYLAPDQKWKFFVEFSCKKAYYHHGLERDANNRALELFTTKNMFSAHTGLTGVGIWICSPDDEFFSASHQVSQFHHSSFLAGGRVRAAGEWIFSAGELLLITHNTGHYQTPRGALFRALAILDTRLNLEQTVVMSTVYARERKETFVKALDFLKASGNIDRCPTLQSANAESILKDATTLSSQGLGWSERSTLNAYGVYQIIKK